MAFFITELNNLFAFFVRGCSSSVESYIKTFQVKNKLAVEMYGNGLEIYENITERTTISKSTVLSDIYDCKYAVR